MIIETLDGKELNPKVKKVVSTVKENYEKIKEEFIQNKTDSIDSIVKNILLA